MQEQAVPAETKNELYYYLLVYSDQMHGQHPNLATVFALTWRICNDSALILLIRVVAGSG